MSAEPHAIDHLYLFIYANYLLFHVLFVWIFSIYLFTYLNHVNRTTRKRPPVFVYLCKLPVVSMCLSFEYSYLFVYLFKSMSTKPHASDHLYLFIYANYLLSPCAVRMNINIYLFTYSNQFQQKLALFFS